MKTAESIFLERNLHRKVGGKTIWRKVEFQFPQKAERVDAGWFGWVSTHPLIPEGISALQQELVLGMGIALVVRYVFLIKSYLAATAWKASRAAVNVASTSSLPCAVLKKAASNCEGGSQTPWSSMARWKRPKAVVSLCAAWV